MLYNQLKVFFWGFFEFLQLVFSQTFDFIPHFNPFWNCIIFCVSPFVKLQVKYVKIGLVQIFCASIWSELIKLHVKNFAQAFCQNTIKIVCASVLVKLQFNFLWMHLAQIGVKCVEQAIWSNQNSNILDLNKSIMLR